MTTVRKGLFFSLSERYVLIVIQLAGSMLLARLLTPEEIGIYSVSIAVIGIAQVLRDFGIGPFLIQEKNLSESHIRTAFGFSLLIGFTLFFIVYAAAPLAGKFYNEPRLIETLRISAFNFLVLPFCSISLALLRRNMEFKRLVIVNLAAAFTGFLLGISLAYAGFGPNSMAVAAVASNIMTGTLAWLARTDRKVLMPSFSEWRVLLRFGGQSSAANVVTTISMDINDLALGKILGFAPVAIISRAQGLMNLFHRDIMAAIRGVAFPSFAKTHREGGCVDTLYVTSVTTVTAFAWPFYGFSALYAYEMIRLMFGPQWDEAAALVPIFCLAGAFAATYNLLNNAVMAVGRIDLVTKAELTVQPLRALLIVAAAIIFKSLLACAIAFLIAFALITPFLYKVKDKCIPTNYKALWTGLVYNLKLTALTLLVPTILIVQVPEQKELAGMGALLAVAAIMAGISWIAGLFILAHPLKDDPILQRAINWLPKNR
jgi:O-antigen/teichoic acid export membrane protein